MAKKAIQASPIQIILFTYIVITAPALLLAYYTVKTIDDELARHVELSNHGIVQTGPRTAENLVLLGEYLRDHSFPFAKTKSEHSNHSTVQFQEWTEKLRSERAAILYSWLALLCLGLIVYVFLARRLQAVYGRLVTSIDNLRNRKLNEKIEIEDRSVLRDVSTSLESLRKQLNHDEKQQQKFLRHISHGIKTPLTSIKEGSTLLDQQLIGAMNSDQKEITAILVRSSIELQNAVEDLLEYNAAVGIKQDTQRSKICLSTIVDSILDNNELAIKQKKLRLNLSLAECEALVDHRQIKAVFDNLLSNAIKHSPIGEEITIKISQDRAGNCCFQISDNGTGIDSADREFIFDPFYIGSRQSENTVKGTGLGLSIAKQYIDDHQGQITLIDNPIGTTFRVCIPTEKS